MQNQYRCLLVDNQGDICRVTINRPGDRNSIDTTLMGELQDLLENIEQTQCRVIVFTGAGDAYFIGGADGVEMMLCGPAEAKAFSGRIQNLFNRMEASSLILVSAINGICLGGGFEFALACDLRVAAETARIGLPEVKVGIIPGGGGTQRLPALVGTGRAMEMILSGKLYAAKDAHEMGLIHKVVPLAELSGEVDKTLEPILRNPQHALSQAKRAVRAAQKKSLTDGLQIENDAFSHCFQHGYFVGLMRRQLKEGILPTTVRLPDWIYAEGKKKT